MHWNKKKNITFSIIFVITALSIWLLVNYSSNNQNVNGNIQGSQGEHLLKDISNNDENLLKNMVNSFYPQYQGLYQIGYDIAHNNKSKTVLQIANQSLMNQSNYEAACDIQVKSCTYGIGKDQERDKRNIIGKTISLFESQFHNKYHEYSFIATPQCNMYLLEPFERQQNLVTGNYSYHPWCIELKNNPIPNRAYATETYYTKNILRPYNSIEFPIMQPDNKIAFFGLGLNLFNMTNDFFNNNNLGVLKRDGDLRLFLIANHTNPSENFTNISEPGVQFPPNKNIQDTPLTSLNFNEKKDLIKKINEFDNRVQPTTITLNGKIYFISATSNNIPPSNNNIDPHYPIKDNADRQVTWEWVLLRIYTTNSFFAPPVINQSQLSLIYDNNNYLIVIVILAIILGTLILTFNTSGWRLILGITRRNLPRGQRTSTNDTRNGDTMENEEL